MGDRWGDRERERPGRPLGRGSAELGHPRVGEAKAQKGRTDRQGAGRWVAGLAPGKDAGPSQAGGPLAAPAAPLGPRLPHQTRKPVCLGCVWWAGRPSSL